MNQTSQNSISLTKNQAERLEGRFRDAQGRTCTLTESIRATEGAIWVGLSPDNFERRDETPYQALLTRGRFNQILPALESFSSGGTLPYNISFRDVFGSPVVITSFGADQISLGIVLPKADPISQPTPNDYMRAMDARTGQLFERVESMLSSAAKGDLSAVETDRRIFLSPTGTRALIEALHRMFSAIEGES